MKTYIGDNEDLALADLPGPVEIKIAIEYLAKESRKLEMSFVADLLNSASLAINEYLGRPCKDGWTGLSPQRAGSETVFLDADSFSRVSLAQIENMLGLETEDD